MNQELVPSEEQFNLLYFARTGLPAGNDGAEPFTSGTLDVGRIAKAHPRNRFGSETRAWVEQQVSKTLARRASPY